MNGRGSGPESERFERAMEMFVRKERMRSVRPVLVHSRRAEATLDVSQLPVKSSVNLRHSTGAMIFVAGYSTVGGPDVADA